MGATWVGEEREGYSENSASKGVVWVKISHLLFLVNPSLAQTPFFPTQLLPSFYTEHNSRVTALGSFPLAEEGQGPWSWQNCHPISVPDSP